MTLSLLVACGAPNADEPKNSRDQPARKQQGKPSLPASEPTLCAEPSLPAQLARARSASVVVRFGERGGCSATKVRGDLLLTAAHCKTGYTGDEDLGAPWFERGGKRYPLRVVETGKFRPADGHMEDWLLVGTVGDSRPFDGIASAAISSDREIERKLDSLSDTLDERSTPVWTITYPMPSARECPRPSFQGGQVASRGFLKTDRAYRTAVAIALATGVVYDDRIPGPPPVAEPGHRQRWSTEPNFGPRAVFDLYRSDGAPLLFHSADFAPGSSGGGVFDEATGKLIGIIPFGSTVVSRRDAYGGIDGMYRLDSICERSKRLDCSAP